MQEFDDQSLRRIGRSVRITEKLYPPGKMPVPLGDGVDVDFVVNSSSVISTNQSWEYTTEQLTDGGSGLTGLVVVPGGGTFKGYNTWEDLTKAGYENTSVTGLKPIPNGAKLRGRWAWRDGDTEPCIVFSERNEPIC